MTIDWWTLGIQTVNVLILIWLLGRFFWRPVAGMIAQRRATADKMLADAAAEKSAAQAGLAEIERVRAGFAAERDAVLAAAREEAERVRDALRDAARADATALLDVARNQIEHDKASSELAWRERASRLAVDIASQLASRLDGPDVRAAFLDWLVGEIKRLPETARAALAQGDVGLEAVSATPLDNAEQARCRQQIQQACGGSSAIAFTTDPTLIAGLELRTPHLVVSNSWRADLDRILRDIAHDD